MVTHASRISKAAHSLTLPLFLYDLSAAMQFFAPAAVLPAQFHSRPASDSSLGEIALMRAKCLVGLTRTTARRWRLLLPCAIRALHWRSPISISPEKN